MKATFDNLVKSQKCLLFVISANAGTQENQSLLDSRFRGSDGLGDFLRDRQISNFYFLISPFLERSQNNHVDANRKIIIKEIAK